MVYLKCMWPFVFPFLLRLVPRCFLIHTLFISIVTKHESSTFIEMFKGRFNTNYLRLFILRSEHYYITFLTTCMWVWNIILRLTNVFIAYQLKVSKQYMKSLNNIFNIEYIIHPISKLNHILRGNFITIELNKKPEILL
jgi:hypothetical protein